MNAAIGWDEYVFIQQGPNLRFLAGFVPPAVVDQIGAAGLGIADAHVVGEPAVRSVDVERLFQNLASRNIGYRLEEIDEHGTQIIRPWARIDRVGGTCLDLALLSCAQLRHAQMRPYLALHYSDGAEHATVLVDLERHFDDPRESWPQGTSQVSGGVACWDARSWEPASERWLLYDPTEACADRPRSFTQARTSAASCATAEGTVTWLVDIAAALDDRDVLPRELPDPRAPGLLSRRCPPVPATVDFPSRAEIRSRVSEGVGTTVIAGPRGTGKSLLALRGITHGIGWFLNSSSPQTLASDLAEQEIFERGPSQVRAAHDIDGFAQEALNRLRSSTGPWVVVVDNADVPVRDLRHLLPRPDPTRRQHLIITTTDLTVDGRDAGWAHWAAAQPDTRLLRVLPLTEQECRTFLAGPDDLPLPETARKPLTLRATRGLLRHAHHDQARRILASSDPETCYWDELRPLLDEQPRLAARLVAAMPPVPIAARLLIPQLPSAEHDLGELEELGLLTRSAGAWTIHGLHAKAIRSDHDHDREAGDELVRLLGDLGFDEHLRRNYDATTVKAIAAAVAAAEVPDTDRGTAFARLSDILDERGTARESSEVASKGLPLLAPDDRDHRAACHLALGRFIFQHTPIAAQQMQIGRDAAVERALAHAQQAEDLAVELRLRWKAMAMRGLLVKRQGLLARDHLRRRELLAQAMDIVSTALQGREELYADDENNLELAKARFNMGGLWIESAKADPANAQAHLANALDQYYRVERARRSVYGDGAHRHIASCTAGAATTRLYEALLCADSTEQAQQSLRESTIDLLQSLQDRLVVDGGDGSDVVKSLRLLAKVVMTRLVLAAGNEEVLWDPQEGLLLEVRKELRPLSERGLTTASYSPTRFTVGYCPHGTTLPGYGDLPMSSDDLRRRIDTWMRDPHLASLVHTCAGAVPDVDLETVMDYLDDFAATHWDFRQGRERNMANSPELASEVEQAAVQTARALGMIGTHEPHRSRYSHVVVLGGLATACLARPAFAAALVRQGVSTRDVVALTAYREFVGDESQTVALMGRPELTNEFEAMRTGMARAFGLRESSLETFDPGKGATTRMSFRGGWQTEAGYPVELVVAPSPDPARRANTGETFQYWADQVELTPDDSLLVVTSSIYVPQQHCNAVLAVGLKYGCRIETIGIDNADQAPPLRQQFTPAKYLQEIRSAIHAMRELYREVVRMP